MDSVVFPTLPTYMFEPSLAGVLSLALTVLLPLLGALLMRASWSAFRKGLVLWILAASKAYLEAWIGHVEAGEAFNFVTTFYSTFVQFGIAVIAYVGWLKNTNLQQRAIRGGLVQERTVPGQARWNE